MPCVRCVALGRKCPSHLASKEAVDRKRLLEAAKPGAVLCRHCRRFVATRRRRLCPECYYSPARDLYPSESKYARLTGDDADINGGYALPPGPTDALPGTPGKWRAFRERIRLCVALHHPDDARVSLA